MGVAVGIDLGTTNTVVSAVKDGWPVTLVDTGNRRLLPSVVSFHPSGKILVGHSAKERRIVDPTSTIFSVKRLIGRGWDSPEVQRACKTMPFELAEGDGHEVQVLARGERYTLPEISAFILRRAKAIAEAALGEPVRQAVITVPANFNDPQREATKLAGKLAGLEVLRILSEPTAAALAYGESTGKKERVAVYDLGGGTFDATLLDVSGAVFQVLATGGDTALGGDDMDELIAGLMNESLLRQHRYDARTDPTARATLKARAEELKILLSADLAAEVPLNNLVRGEGGQFLPASFRLERTVLEALVAPLLERTLETCRRTVEKVGSTIAEVDRILLVGGSTRMPLVGRRVEEWFGRKVSARVNPDEVVAHGAAVQAAALSRVVEVGAPSFRPRPSFSFAVSLGDEAVQPAVTPSTPAPGPVDVPLPPKMPDNLTAGRRSSMPPAVAASASQPPQGGPPPSARPSGAAWPPIPDPPPSAGPVSRSSRPPLSQDQEALLKAFLDADSAPSASPSRPPAPLVPAAAPAPVAPPASQRPAAASKPLADIESELKAFLSDAPPPPAKAAPSEGIVAAPESRPPSALSRPATPYSVTPQRADHVGVIPAVGSHPPPVITDRPPVAPARPPPPVPPPRAAAPPAAPAAPPPAPAARPAPSGAPPRPVANPLLIDVTPLSLGVETVGGFCDVIIRANSPVPCDRDRVFQTASDGQTSVLVKICQGESERFAENTTLGDLRLSGFRAAPRGEVAITVRFEIDADGILNVQAKELSTGQSAAARIELLGAQTDAKKVQAMMDRQASREVA